MSRTDWNRPRFRTQGRLTEDLNGADVPMQRPLRKPQPSRIEQRASVDAAVAAYLADGGSIKRIAVEPRPGALDALRPTTSNAASVSKPKPDEAPPWT